MINEQIQYINKLGHYNILDIIPQKDGSYFMAITYNNEVASFECHCTEQTVRYFRKKILENNEIIVIKNR